MGSHALVTLDFWGESPKTPVAQVSRRCPAPAPGKGWPLSTSSVASISWVPPSAWVLGPSSPHRLTCSRRDPWHPLRYWQGMGMGPRTPVLLELACAYFLTSQPHQSGLCAPVNPAQMVPLWLRAGAQGPADRGPRAGLSGGPQLRLFLPILEAKGLF